MFTSVGAIIKFDNKYLLQLRDDKPNIYFPNYWGLFGGATEANEEPIDAVRREILEEISLEIKNGSIFLTLTIETKFFENIRKRIFFKCNIDSASSIVLNEGQSFKFYEFNEIQSLKIVPFDFSAIAFYEHNQL